MARPAAEGRQKSAWIREYTRGQGIESSYTPKAERCVLALQARLVKSGMKTGRLLDLGCGRGRNSLPWLRSGWTVTGLDAAQPALRAFRSQARIHGRRLRLAARDLSGRLPWAAASFDVVMEITVADNLINLRARLRLWREIARVLKPGGFFLSYHFNPEDGYYGPLLKVSPAASRGLLYDPRAGMHFRFYRAAEILEAARGRFKLLHSKVYRYPGPMFGSTYVRHLTAALFQRQKGCQHAVRRPAA